MFTKQSFKESIKEQIKQSWPQTIILQLIQQTLKKLNIVTREEFDIQTKVLQTTRKKLDDLEEKIKLATVNTNANADADAD